MSLSFLAAPGLSEAIDLVLIDALEDWVQACQVDRNIEVVYRPTTRDERIRRFLEVVRELLEEELAAVGDVMRDAGFVPWNLSLGDALLKMERHWQALGDERPNLGDICWLASTSLGKKRAQKAGAKTVYFAEYSATRAGGLACFHVYQERTTAWGRPCMVAFGMSYVGGEWIDRAVVAGATLRRLNDGFPRWVEIFKVVDPAAVTADGPIPLDALESLSGGIAAASLAALTVPEWQFVPGEPILTLPLSPLDTLIAEVNSRDRTKADEGAQHLRELPHDMLQSLVDRLTEGCDAATVRAVVAVGAAAVPVLLAAVEEHGLGWMIGDALIRLNERGAIPLFVRELKTPGSAHREIAARALGEMGVTEEIPLLRPLLGDEDAGVAAEAASTLGMLGDTDSVTEIVRIARESDIESRTYAIYGLSLLDHPVAREKLVALLSDPDHWVRESAIRGVARAGVKAAVTQLLDMFDGADYDERYELLMALARLPVPSSVPKLRHIADTGGPPFAELAATALLAAEAAK